MGRKFGDGPPIVKFVFVHWIGPEVSPVRRGQWNSKLEEASTLVRKFCDFAFRRTAYVADDFDPANFINELARLTCNNESRARRISVDWYFEGLAVAREAGLD